MPIISSPTPAVVPSRLIEVGYEVFQFAQSAGGRRVSPRLSRPSGKSIIASHAS
ncbi:unannotated protein [freshwater metagenome]|uniref:Unannotated protein n=1 Tax=freshwater metagenome TaxID=449393 RepID=A0A6J6XPL4_9ZZZZ